MMTIEQLKTRLADAQQVHAQHVANANVAAGACQMLAALISEEEKALESSTQLTPECEKLINELQL